MAIEPTVFTEDVLDWPEWRSLASRLGVLDTQHPLKIVLTLESECLVYVEHHYYACQMIRTEPEKESDDVKVSGMRR